MEGYVVAILIFVGITVCGYVLAGIAGIIALDCLCRACCTTPSPADSGAFGTGEQTLERRPRRKEEEFEKYIQENI